MKESRARSDDQTGSGVTGEDGASESGESSCYGMPDLVGSTSDDYFSDPHDDHMDPDVHMLDTSIYPDIVDAIPVVTLSGTSFGEGGSWAGHGSWTDHVRARLQCLWCCPGVDDSDPPNVLHQDAASVAHPPTQLNSVADTIGIVSMSDVTTATLGFELSRMSDLTDQRCGPEMGLGGWGDLDLIPGLQVETPDTGNLDYVTGSHSNVTNDADRDGVEPLTLEFGSIRVSLDTHGGVWGTVMAFQQHMDNPVRNAAMAGKATGKDEFDQSEDPFCNYDEFAHLRGGVGLEFPTSVPLSNMEDPFYTELVAYPAKRKRMFEYEQDLAESSALRGWRAAVASGRVALVADIQGIMTGPDALVQVREDFRLCSVLQVNMEFHTSSLRSVAESEADVADAISEVDGLGQYTNPVLGGSFFGVAKFMKQAQRALANSRDRLRLSRLVSQVGQAIVAQNADGLANRGNTCYVNAAVQAIAGLAIFGGVSVNRVGTIEECQCRESDCALCEHNRQVVMMTASFHFAKLHRHAQPRESAGSRAYHIQRLADSLRGVAPAEFTAWEALDARDALDWMLRSLEVQFELTQRDIGWQVSTTVVTACANCPYRDSSASTLSSMLLLDIPHGLQTISVQDLVKHHFAESLMACDGCPECQQSARGVGVYHQGLECSTLPSVVMLVAKRNGSEGLSIDFSAEQDGLDLGRLAHVSDPCPKYDLVSVVVYVSPQSGAHIGHFVTLARDSSRHPWHVYDDTTVRIAQAKDLEGEGAYMFVYLQQGHDTTPDASSDDGHHTDLGDGRDDDEDHRDAATDEDADFTGGHAGAARSGVPRRVVTQPVRYNSSRDAGAQEQGLNMVADHNAHGLVENILGLQVLAETAVPALHQGTIAIKPVTAATPMAALHSADKANPVGPDVSNMHSPAITASDGESNESVVSETDEDDALMVESGDDDEVVEGAGMNDTAPQQPSTKCAQMAAAAGMAGYSDWNCHEWLIIQVQAALDDPESLLLQNATLWHATRRNFVYRPETASDDRKFFSIGDIIAAQIMCAPAHQNILHDMARGTMRPVWSYALPQTSALFASTKNVVYAHGFRPGKQALEHEAARTNRTPIWRCRCRLASQGDRWMWYFGESCNLGDHRLNQHWVSRSGLLYWALNTFGAPVHSVILWNGDTRKSLLHQTDDRKVAELVMQISLGGVVRERSLNIVPCGWWSIPQNVGRSTGIPRWLFPLISYEMEHSDAHKGPNMDPVPGVHGKRPRIWRIDTVDHAQTTVASLQIERLDIISEAHDAATIKGLLWSMRSMRSGVAATKYARREAIEMVAVPFLSANATLHLPGTHGHTGSLHVHRPVWECLCSRCQKRRTAADVFMNSSDFIHHCTHVHPTELGTRVLSPKVCIDRTVETHEYWPRRGTRRNRAVPQKIAAYRCPLCETCQKVRMRTTHSMITHLARSGVFADDPEIARVGGRPAARWYDAHWIELGRMRASDPQELLGFLRGHADAQPTPSGGDECMWVCRCASCTGVRANGFREMDKGHHNRHAAMFNFVPEHNRTVIDRPVWYNSSGKIATGYVCACPRCLEPQYYNTTPLGTIALLRHLLANHIFPVSRFSGVFGDLYCREKLRRHRYTRTTHPPAGL